MTIMTLLLPMLILMLMLTDDDDDDDDDDPPLVFFPGFVGRKVVSSILAEPPGWGGLLWKRPGGVARGSGCGPLPH